MPRLALDTLTRVRHALAFLLLIAGPALITAGALGPWAQVTLFKNIDVSLSGIFFAQGGSCLAVAALVLLGGRRWPLVCLVGALFVLGWTQEARNEVPGHVIKQLLGAQGALIPINRLLDQFHINDAQGTWAIQIVAPSTRREQLVGPGLSQTVRGGWLLLLGSVLGLPGDPLVAWAYARTARVRCRACGSQWRLARGALFCPECGTPSPTARGRLCPACHAPVKKTDRHCIACGTTLTADG